MTQKQNIDTILFYLEKNVSYITWRSFYADNGAEVFSTILDGKLIELEDDEFSNVGLRLTCLKLKKINRIWVTNPEQIKQIRSTIQKIKDNHLAHENLWSELAANLNSYKPVVINGIVGSSICGCYGAVGDGSRKCPDCGRLI